MRELIRKILVIFIILLMLAVSVLSLAVRR